MAELYIGAMVLTTKCSLWPQDENHEDSDKFGDIMPKEKYGGKNEWLRREPPGEMVRGINGIYSAGDFENPLLSHF